jgi:hypothetical protein
MCFVHHVHGFSPAYSMSRTRGAVNCLCDLAQPIRIAERDAPPICRPGPPSCLNDVIRENPGLASLEIK